MATAAPVAGGSPTVAARIAELAFVALCPAVAFWVMHFPPIAQNGFIDPFIYTGYINNFEDLIQRYGITYPNVYDGKGSTVGRYGVTGFPETYFIDRNGDVVYRIAGPVLEEEDLDEGVERALARA